MADSGIHLLDVTVRPSPYVKDVIAGSWLNLKAGSKDGNGKIVYGFKVGFLGTFK